VLAITVLLAACDNGTNADDPKTETRSEQAESGLDDAGDPVRGGRLVYALDAESNDGFCLPEAALTPSGLMVQWAIYDALTVLNDKAEAVPNLATSLEHSDDYKVWTIKVRDGVKFHDGTDLTEEVVKNNLDAYRGAFPARSPLLQRFVLSNIDSVTVTAPMTVEVGTKRPWVAFPSILSPLGIMSQSQLQDPETCHSKLVGTGPFKLSSWVPSQKMITQRNADYWNLAPDGEPYPYFDSLEFRPIPDSQQRVIALENGDIDALMTAVPKDIVGPLTDMRNDGFINMLVSEDHAEVNFLMFNNGKPPFDDITMRKAVAMGLDREMLNDVANAGFPTVADQPFPPGDMGYVDDPGFPQFDRPAAKKLVDDYVAKGGAASLTLTVQSDPTLLARAEEIQIQLAEIGIEIKIQTVDQPTLVSTAIGGDYQAMSFRRHPGGEPDLQYLWWYGVDNPVNFARIKDETIDKLLDTGRSEPDPELRAEAYEGVSRRFGEMVWNVWLNYTPWAVVMAADVHGALNVRLPNGDDPFTGLATGHPLKGMWRADS
jgi:peptide/nickel transport system substrate-binding protein